MSLTPVDVSAIMDSSNLTYLSLPAGVSLQQFQSAERVVVTIAIANAVALALIVWDHLLLLPHEIQLYKSSTWDVWAGPAIWSFVVLRYAGFLSTFAAVLFTVMPSNHCQTILVMVQLGNILVMISSGLIFGYRVTALWAGNKGINILIGSMYTIMIICWVVVSTQAHAINGPPAFIGSNCQLLPLVPWAPLSYATCFVYNAVILMLTIRKIPLQTKSPVGYLLFRDSLVYFVCTTITNLVVLAIQSFSANLNLNQMKPTATPFATLITTAVGCRLFLNLKMLNQGKEPMTPSATIGSFQSPPAIAEKFHGKPLALLGRGKSSPKQLMRRASDESFATSYESDAKITRPMSTASYDSTYETVVDHDYDTRKLPQIHSRQSIPQDIYLSNKGYEHEDDVLLNNDDLHRSRV